MAPMPDFSMGTHHTNYNCTGLQRCLPYYLYGGDDVLWDSFRRKSFFHGNLRGAAALTQALETAINKLEPHERTRAGVTAILQQLMDAVEPSYLLVQGTVEVATSAVVGVTVHAAAGLHDGVTEFFKLRKMSDADAQGLVDEEHEVLACLQSRLALFKSPADFFSITAADSASFEACLEDLTSVGAEAKAGVRQRLYGVPPTVSIPAYYGVDLDSGEHSMRVAMAGTIICTTRAMAQQLQDFYHMFEWPVNAEGVLSAPMLAQQSLLVQATCRMRVVEELHEALGRPLPKPFLMMKAVLRSLQPSLLKGYTAQLAGGNSRLLQRLNSVTAQRAEEIAVAASQRVDVVSDTLSQLINHVAAIERTANSAHGIAVAAQQGVGIVAQQQGQLVGQMTAVQQQVEALEQRQGELVTRDEAVGTLMHQDDRVQRSLAELQQTVETNQAGNVQALGNLQQCQFTGQANLGMVVGQLQGQQAEHNAGMLRLQASNTAIIKEVSSHKRKLQAIEEEREEEAGDSAGPAVAPTFRRSVKHRASTSTAPSAAAAAAAVDENAGSRGKALDVAAPRPFAVLAASNGAGVAAAAAAATLPSPPPAGLDVVLQRIEVLGLGQGWQVPAAAAAQGGVEAGPGAAEAADGVNALAEGEGAGGAAAAALPVPVFDPSYFTLS